MPTTSFLYVILLYLPCVFFHELGHAIFARCAGIHVMACGIGYAKPIFSMRLFGIHFYIARRNITGGLTLFVDDPSQHDTKKIILAIAGGTIANFLLIIVSFILWLQWTSPVLAAVFYINVYMFLISAIPSSFPFGEGCLRNDAKVISDYLRKQISDTPIKMQIASIESIRELCRDIDCWEGVIYMNNRLASAYIALQNWQKAQEILQDDYFHHPRRNSFEIKEQQEIECFVQFLKDPEDKEVRKQLDDLCKNSKGAQLLFLSLQVDKNMYDENTVKGIRELLDTFGKTRPEISFLLEGILLKIDPPENFVAKYEAIFPKIHNYIPALSIELSIYAIECCIKQNNLDKARILFARTNKLFSKIHKNLNSEEQVKSTIKKLSNQLLEVINQAKSDVALFVDNDAFHPQIKKPPQKNYANLCGIMSLFVLAFSLPIFLHYHSLQKTFFASIYLAAMGIFFSLPILKKRQNVAKNFLFNFTVLCITIVIIITVVRFEKYDDLITYLTKEKIKKQNHEMESHPLWLLEKMLQTTDNVQEKYQVFNEIFKRKNSKSYPDILKKISKSSDKYVRYWTCYHIANSQHIVEPEIDFLIANLNDQNLQEYIIGILGNLGKRAQKATTKLREILEKSQRKRIQQAIRNVLEKIENG